MPSNREAYFEALALNIPKAVINFALQEINGFSYFELVQNFDKEIKDYASFKNAIGRYLNGEMIEYIFNKAYFLSTPFYVDKSVLIPRQETEQLVQIAIERIPQLFADSKLAIADVCTGSGVIGLSIAKALPDYRYYLSDISKEAIRVAKLNASNLEIKRVSFLVGDMLTPFIDSNIKLDALICNPPYISNVENIDEKTWKNEPHLALLANPCTLFYEKIFQDYAKTMKERFCMFFEIGEDMEDSLTILLRKYLPYSEYEFKKDIYGKTRFLFVVQK